MSKKEKNKSKKTRISRKASKNWKSGSTSFPERWYGNKYIPPVEPPDRDYLIMDDDPGIKQAYYEKLSTDILIYYADYADCFGDTMPIIYALFKRDPDKAILLARDILIKGKAFGCLDEEVKEFLQRNDWLPTDEDDLINIYKY